MINKEIIINMVIEELNNNKELRLKLKKVLFRDEFINDKEK